MPTTHCTECENHCPAKELRCNRGRKAFGLPPLPEDHHREDHHRESRRPEGALGLLMQCGHRLHHGQASPETFLSPLTAEEQEQLTVLLRKPLGEN